MDEGDSYHKVGEQGEESGGEHLERLQVYILVILRGIYTILKPVLILSCRTDGEPWTIPDALIPLPPSLLSPQKLLPRPKDLESSKLVVLHEGFDERCLSQSWP